MAFDAMMERYSREEVAIVMYHLHIPFPDPMANPSTEARAQFCGARGTPSYLIDGEKGVGGGDRDEAKSYYEKINPPVEKRLEKPAEARIMLQAVLQDEVVKVKVLVDRVASKSPDLMLQIALVEENLSYSGQGGLRFHPMVVRSLGGEKALGFHIKPSGVTKVEHAFDLLKITQELKKHIEDMEKDRKMTFSVTKHKIDEGQLAVAAFVQDSKNKQVLQAAFIKPTLQR